MRLDESNPFNEQVVGDLRRAQQSPSAVAPISSPTDHADPYMRLGSHPDIVERVWDQLGSALPSDCRAVVYGAPALVEPRTGIILALAYGTAYVLRVPAGRLEAALQAGCRFDKDWTCGGHTNLQEKFGPGWVFGNWSEVEAQWLREMHDILILV